MDRATPLVECVNLYRELPAHESNPPKSLLTDVSFTIQRGEVLAVLGPSGAGKSTLLRLLNRLDEPTGGTVLLGGVDTHQIAPRELRRRMGMVMQRAFLFPGTVASNICFGPLQNHATLSGKDVEDLLSRVGLAGYAERDALTLSGGEAQRVAITRALANKPEVLLLDEPTSALDADARQDVEALLERLIRENSLTCVWVTHDEAQAARMADQVLMLQSGRVTASGEAKKLLSA
jgi:putative ABC transport system ATP-binding protein